MALKSNDQWWYQPYDGSSRYYFNGLFLWHWCWRVTQMQFSSNLKGRIEKVDCMASIAKRLKISPSNPRPLSKSGLENQRWSIAALPRKTLLSLHLFWSTMKVILVLSLLFQLPFLHGARSEWTCKDRQPKGDTDNLFRACAGFGNFSDTGSFEEDDWDYLGFTLTFAEPTHPKYVTDHCSGILLS